jgi:NOL1/NOP2/fmu family ribosome biogenesis protein
VQGEGFFIACMRKGDGDIFSSPRKAALPEKASKKEQESLGPWLTSDQPLYLFRHQEQIHALPESLAHDLPILQSACYLKKAGITLGSLSVKEFIPDHDLAMSTLIDPQLPAVSLKMEQALHYLRKEELHPDTPYRGWTLAQYQGHNLGWIKVLPNRSNNYYPKEWRILKRDH